MENLHLLFTNIVLRILDCYAIFGSNFDNIVMVSDVFIFGINWDKVIMEHKHDMYRRWHEINEIFRGPYATNKLVSRADNNGPSLRRNLFVDLSSHPGL